MEPLPTAELLAFRKLAVPRMSRVASVTAEGIVNSIKNEGKFDALCESIVTDILNKGVTQDVEIELGNELNKLLEQSVSVGATPTVAALVSRVMDFLNKRSHVANTVTSEIIVELMRGRVINEKIDIALNGTFAAVEDAAYVALCDRARAKRVRELARASHTTSAAAVTPSTENIDTRGNVTGDDFEDAWEDTGDGGGSEAATLLLTDNPIAHVANLRCSDAPLDVIPASTAEWTPTDVMSARGPVTGSVGTGGSRLGSSASVAHAHATATLSRVSVPGATATPSGATAASLHPVQNGHGVSRPAKATVEDDTSIDRMLEMIKAAAGASGPTKPRKVAKAPLTLLPPANAKTLEAGFDPTTASGSGARPALDVSSAGANTSGPPAVGGSSAAAGDAGGTVHTGAVASPGKSAATDTPVEDVKPLLSLVSTGKSAMQETNQHMHDGGVLDLVATVAGKPQSASGNGVDVMSNRTNLAGKIHRDGAGAVRSATNRIDKIATPDNDDDLSDVSSVHTSDLSSVEVSSDDDVPSEGSLRVAPTHGATGSIENPSRTDTQHPSRGRRGTRIQKSARGGKRARQMPRSPVDSVAGTITATRIAKRLRHEPVVSLVGVACCSGAIDSKSGT